MKIKDYKLKVKRRPLVIYCPLVSLHNLSLYAKPVEVCSAGKTERERYATFQIGNRHIHSAPSGYLMKAVLLMSENVENYFPNAPKRVFSFELEINILGQDSSYQRTFRSHASVWLPGPEGGRDHPRDYRLTGVAN